MNGEMRALIKETDAPGLTMTTVPIPQVGMRDVLIKVDKVGICGTDLHIYDWDEWAKSRVKLGTTIGHEFMGRVVKTGAAVRNVSVGDRVTAEGHIGCGFCYCCRTGQGHICDKVDIIGVDINGCFADYVRMPEENVWRLHPNISDEVGAIHDPLGNAMHTVMVDNVSGRTVLIVGAGTIGMLIASIARAAGALQIASLDVNPKKLELARHMGADIVGDPRQPGIEEELRANTRGGRGYDVMLEASGNEAGIRTGFRLLRSGGWAALLGIPKRDVSFNLAEDVIFKGITIHGVNGRRMFETWYQVEGFLKQKRITVDPVITHRLPLERYAEGFDAMRRGEAVKVVLDVAGSR